MRKTRIISRKLKPKFAIVVDGDCEFWYIQMLKRNERSVNVDLKPEIPQKKKLSEQFERVLELSNDYDKVFWIIDFDVINTETRSRKKGEKSSLQEIREYASNIKENYENITVIVNNPCLEYWILLHFESISKYFDTCEKASRRLKKYLPLYQKNQNFYTKQNNDIYLKLKPLLSNAITNAKKLGKFNFNLPHKGMTQMHFLFESKEIKDNISFD